jgi:asparagine synthase (glutamine-hydrolysing)
MSYADERYWLTYNGELYNFRELRAGLEREGFRFLSDCDTEVVLALYARYGRQMFEHMNGIFAFALWDCQRRELLLARDRLGVKPLYYALQGGCLFFASEIKALLPALPSRRMRPSALADYLTFLWVPEPGTLFEGIFKLPAGHYAVYADGRLSLSEYWDMGFMPEVQEADSWPRAIREQVHQAVRRQMVSDVPLGAFLSGGIDSSAIVAEMSRGRKTTTYTVGFSAEDLRHEIVPDDLQYARQMGRAFGTDYHEQILRPEIVELLPKLVWHMDEPIADPAAITTFLICSAASERLTVILSGMGGDEIFAGYPRHLAAQYGRVADRVPVALRRLMREALEGRLTLGRPGRLRGPRRNLMKFMRGLDLPFEERYLVYRSYYKSEELRRLFSTEFRTELGSHDSFCQHRELFARVRGEHWLNQLLYVDMKTFLPCLNLAYTDKMSMAASTEVRVPLLDDELVALSSRIPPGLKLRGRTRKYVFKKSMEGVLPREVIWRPKAGFGAPLRAWLGEDLKPLLDEALSPGNVRSRGLFEPRAIEQLRRRAESGEEDNALRLWALLTLEIWQGIFLDNPSGATPASSNAR